MRIPNLMRHFLQSGAGVAAVVFGLMVPVVVSGVGLSVDIARTYLVRERLSHAIDAAALAAAASPSDDPQKVERKVQDFVEANYPPGKVGFTIDIDVESEGEYLNVNATARLDTTFMRVFGKDYVDVYAETQIKREVKAIEAVLVMDVTGSMATNNNIGALKTAAASFINTMFPDKNKENWKNVKVGLVPFSTSVNVGPYGLGKTPSNTTYGTAFVTKYPTDNVYYDQNKNDATNSTNRLKWGGCVLEGAYPKDTQDHSGPWAMYRYCRNGSNQVVCDSGNANTKPNYVCPKASIMPLTDKKSELLAHVNTLEASGNTYVNVGLVWGLRVISPSKPFDEGVSWEDPDWKKAVILMTDGNNEVHANYSVYGPSASANMTNAKLNSRVLDVCDELKAKGVLVYTITFYSNISTATKNIYKQCATTPSMWYDAPTQNKLIEVYGTIAKELSNLHITK